VKMHKIGQSAGKTWAYLLGVYLGDGCVYNHQGYLAFVLTVIDLDFVEATREAIRTLSGAPMQYSTYQDPRFPKARLSHRLRCGDVKLCAALREETKDKKEIPGWLFSASKDERLAFIGGLMDSEGYVSAKDGRQGFTMGFKSTDPWFGDFVKLMHSVGILTGKVGIEEPRKPGYRVPRRVSIKVQSWIDAGAYFRCGRKQARVDAWAAMPYKRPPRNLRDYMSGALSEAA
jgi:hypothetical protein